MKSNHLLNLIGEQNKKTTAAFPGKISVINFLEQLTDLLFPVGTEGSEIDKNLSLNDLKKGLNELINPLMPQRDFTTVRITGKYFESLPEIYSQLLLDAEAILEFDPAASSLEEIVLAYPGFHAITTYRLAHPLYIAGIPLLPRLMCEYAHRNTGIDIHPGAKIGKSFFIDHGTGVVIGETAVIGNNVKIYQGVTLGALNVRKEEAMKKRHPTIEDNVIIYSGSTILGGDTVIGHDSVVGGNVWLTRSVPPQSIVYNKSEIRVKSAAEKESTAINFVIYINY